MRIGIDVHTAAKSNRRGVPHYSAEIVRRLIHGWPENLWLLLHVGAGDSSLLPEELRSYRNLTVVNRGRLSTAVTLRASGRYHDRFLDGPDVVFLPAIGPVSASPRVPTVLTVHDMLHLTHREHFGLRHRAWIALARPSRQIERASLLITDSHATRAELQKNTDVDQARIRVIPLGVDDSYFTPCPQAELSAVLDRYHLSSGYVLYLGTIESRKNVGSLVSAIAQLRRRRPATTLVLAGALEAGSREALSGADEGVRVLGMVPEADKRALYTAAAAYCSVSHSEGFGWPVLEALACGTPAVVSDIPAFRETVGPDAAAFVAEREVPGIIAAALEQMLDDPFLGRAILERAPNVLSRYRWEVCARQTYQALLDAHELDPPRVSPPKLQHRVFRP